MAWMYAADEATLSEGSVAPVYPSGVNVVLSRVEGMVYAVSGSCAHTACTLSLGSLNGHTLTCACHDWRFDVRMGRFLVFAIDPDADLVEFVEPAAAAR